MRNEATNLSKNEMIMVMHDQEQEIEKLKAQLAELRSKLNDYDIRVSESGSLADASARISGLFDAAQRTVNTYIDNMKRRDEQSEQKLGEVEKQAEQILADAEEVAKKRLAAADAEIEEKWAVIESRLLVMYESHKGLQELVESGIFTIPGREAK